MFLPVSPLTYPWYVPNLSVPYFPQGARKQKNSLTKAQRHKEEEESSRQGAKLAKEDKEVMVQSLSPAQ